MKNLWRFHTIKGVSGIVIAGDETEAKERVFYYLSIQFDDIGKNSSIEDISVWKCSQDEDFREDYPFVLATNY